MDNDFIVYSSMEKNIGLKRVNLCIWETPKPVFSTFTNSEDPDDAA